MYSWRFNLILAAIAFSLFRSLNAQEIGFVERYALSENRTEALDQLVPGTEDYYYYTALYHQTRGEFDIVEKVLKKWIEDHKTSDRVREIQIGKHCSNLNRIRQRPMNSCNRD